jgi:hypothetical protein
MAYYISRRMHALRSGVSSKGAVVAAGPGTIAAGQRRVVLDTFGAPNNGWGFVLAGDFPTQVVWVDVGSIADFCGLRVGDIILQLNGRDVSRMSKVDVVGALKLFSIRADLVVQQIRTLQIRGANVGESRIDSPSVLSPLGPAASQLVASNNTSGVIHLSSTPAQQRAVQQHAQPAPIALNLSPKGKQPMFDQAYTSTDLPAPSKRVQGSPPQASAPTSRPTQQNASPVKQRQEAASPAKKTSPLKPSSGGPLSSTAAWRHQKPFDKAECQAALAPHPDGTFAIRARVSKDGVEALVLAMKFQGKGTFHKVAVAEDGVLEVTGRRYGDAKSIDGLVANLSADPLPAGWPKKLEDCVDEDDNLVKLGETVLVAAAPTSSGPVDRSTPVNRTNSPAPVVEAPTALPADGEQAWLCRKMTNPEAKAFLEGKPTGTFFVRQLNPGKGEFALTVILEGNVSHHKITAPDGSPAKVNKTELKVEGLSATVTHLRGMYAYWPVSLKGHLTPEDTAAKVEEVAPEEEVPPPRPPKTEAVLAEKHFRDRDGDGDVDLADIKVALEETNTQPWLHQKMGNEEALALLQGKPDGHFLVREHTPPAIFALSVVYKGKPTHHKIKAPEGEPASINNAATPASGISGLVEHLREKQKYWPVPLTEHILGSAGKIESKPADPVPPALPTKAAPPVPTSVESANNEPKATAAAPTAAEPPTKKENKQPWLHPKMSNDEATVFLENKPEGHFLLRNHTPDEGIYALSVVYKGKATHHKVRAPEGGNVMVNTAQTPATNLEELIEHLREKRKYWPVALVDHVKPKGLKKKSTKKRKPSLKKAKRQSLSLDDSSKLWLHPKLHNDEATVLLIGKADGTFLVREHTPAESVYALSVVYKGKPTHHKIGAPEGADGVIGKSKVPAQGIVAVVTHLRSTYPYWPAALTEHIPGTASSKIAPAQPVIAENAEKHFRDRDGDGDVDLADVKLALDDWLHPKMGNGTADGMLADKPDGTFMLRHFKEEEGLFVISVVYKGKSTHHLLNTTEGLINKKIACSKGGVKAVVEQLRNAHKVWPVPLGEHIPTSISL